MTYFSRVGHPGAGGGQPPSNGDNVKRLIGSIAVALLLGTLGTAAAAQEGSGDYPGNGSATTGGGEFTPGGSGSLTINNLNPNTDYSGTIHSDPIPVSGTTDADGSVTFTFAVPSDFELDAQHALVLANGPDLTFCVGGSGAVVSCAALTSAAPTAAPNDGSDSLADTGARYIDDVLRIGLLAIALGFVLLLWHRRPEKA
jgi:hypothetical protein